MAPRLHAGKSAARDVAKDTERVRGLSKQEMGAARRRQEAAEKQALDWIVQHLKANRNEILPFKADLEAGNAAAMIASSGSSGDVMGDAFPESFSNFKSLPREWIAKWMARKCQWDTAFVDRLDIVSGQLKQVFTFLTGLSDFTYWPREALEENVLSELVDFMGDALGQRWKGFQDFVQSDDSVDWLRAGPWQFE